MKKIVFILTILLSTTLFSFAQRFAYVDTEYVLGQLPEYQDAQTGLDAIAENWQTEIQQQYEEIENLYKEYQAEQVLLTEDLRKKREESIIERENEVKKLQKQRFGYKGDLFKKKQELIKPIQDKVYEAVEQLAQKKGYDFILDKSGGASILYANPKLNQTDAILKQLGVN